MHSSELTQLLNAAFRQLQPQQSFPKMNLFLTDSGEYVFEFALAGYKRENLIVEHNRRLKILRVAYKHPEDEVQENKGKIVIGGIANRQFDKEFSTQTDKQEFQIKSTDFVDGILKIVLEPIPEQEGNVTRFTL